MKEKACATIEVHPEWYHHIPDMEVLILGSFPPPPNVEGSRKSRHFEFYYPNNSNKFWKVLAIAGGLGAPKEKECEAAVQERKKIMETLKVGVQNLARVVARPGRSTRDADLKVVELQNIEEIITNSPNLRTILLPSYSGSFSTYHLFLRHIEEQGWSLLKSDNRIAPKVEFYIEKNDRKIRCVIANSTSTRSRVSLDTLVEQFKFAMEKGT